MTDPVSLDQELLEAEEFDTNADEGDREIFPLRRDDINSFNAQITTSDLLLRIKRKTIDLRPSYQRFYVWNDDRAENLIDSLWNGIPIPQIFFLETEEGSLQVIDGQQRLTSLARFMSSDDDFSVKDTLINLLQYRIDADSSFEPVLSVKSKVFSGNNETSEKIKFAELDNSTKNKFLNLSFSCVVIKPNSIDKEKVSGVIIEIFKRLNTGGTKLSPQEIRQSLFESEFMTYIKEKGVDVKRTKFLPLSTHSRFQNDISLSSELVLRCFSLLDAFASNTDGSTIGQLSYKDEKGAKDFKYKPTFEDFFDLYSKIMMKMSDEQIKERQALFNKALDIVEAYSASVEPDTSLPLFYYISKKSTKPVKTFNGNFIDIIMVGIMNALRYGELDVKAVINKIVELQNLNISDPDVSTMIPNRGSDVGNVENRVKFGLDYFSSLVIGE